MNLDRPLPCLRFEELLPLRGRWLRYLVTGVGMLLLAVWWRIGGHDGWASFSTLFSADANHIHCRSTSEWSLFCGGGMSLAGQTGIRLQLGAWELTWIAREFVHSWQEHAVRVGLNLVTAVVSVCGLVHGKLQAIRRGDTGKSIKIGSTQRIVL